MSCVESPVSSEESYSSSAKALFNSAVGAPERRTDIPRKRQISLQRVKENKIPHVVSKILSLALVLAATQSTMQQTAADSLNFGWTPLPTIQVVLATPK